MGRTKQITERKKGKALEMKRLIRTLFAFAFLFTTTSCMTMDAGRALYVTTRDNAREVRLWYRNLTGKDEGADRPDEILPFRWDEVDWITSSDSVDDWDMTIKLAWAAFSGPRIVWAYDGPGPQELGWRETKRISQSPNACFGFVAKIQWEFEEPRWVGAIGEWLPSGYTWQTRGAFKSDRGNKRMFKKPYKYYKPVSGQEFYVFVCGLNWSGQRNVYERSNLLKVIYP